MMRKSILTIISPLLFLVPVSAQYGNAWIDFEKTYYKFTVAEDGVYRIPASVLQQFPGLVNVSGSQFRLYRMGQEVPIYTTTDGNFGPDDYIEFVGEQNRGELDRALYQDADAHQLNPYYSLFTDTAAYFLTWDASGQGERLAGIPNDLTNLPTPEPYYLHSEKWIYHDNLLDPRNASQGAGISYSRFQEGEGFGSPYTNIYTLDIPSSLIYEQGPDATLTIRLASSTLTAHDIQALIDGDTILAHGTGSQFKLYHLTKTIPAGNVQASHQLSIRDYAPAATFTVAYVEWLYAREPDFTGTSYASFVHPGDGNKQYFELNNFDHGGADPVVIDRSAGVRLVAARNGNQIQFLLPDFSGERNLVIASTANAIHSVEKLTPRTFTDYSADNPEYIIITHPLLRAGGDAVGQYAAYRSSVTGGGYDVGIYLMPDLTDQFGYGIAKHPEALRNFNRMMRDNWPDRKMICLIGKAVSYPYSRAHGSSAELHTLVPTFGQPGADHLLFADYGTNISDIPVGRLPVQNQDQLLTYLAKVKEHDQVPFLPQTLEDKGWTKHILHLGGGQDADQQGRILDRLHNMAENAIHSPFGAEVSTFSKSSTNTTGQSNSDKIVEILHRGTSVVKFYGHSSSSTLDFQINSPREWDNKGKYPIFSAMGCKSGDIHQDFLSLSEIFVFEPDAGSIAFIAGSGSQYETPLANWGEDWHTVFGNQFQTLTLGETIHESLKMLNLTSLGANLLVEQQTLNGDPAVRFYTTPGPDYLWDYTSVTREPEILTTDLDSFTLRAHILNIGTNTPSSVTVVAEQRFPNGTRMEVGRKEVLMDGYRAMVEFRIPVFRTSSGLNTIFLTVDSENTVTELPEPTAEQNNELVDAQGKKGYDIFILDNRARAARPLEFSIVTEVQPKFVANSSNAFVKGETFVLELDTTPAFNSPLLLREYYSDFGGVLTWQPFFPYVPGTVYYWRVSSDNGGERVWDTSSFLYQPGGQKGWNQSHYGQFEENVLVDLDFDLTHRLTFDTAYRNIWVQNKIDVEPDLSDDPVVYTNNTLRRDFFTFYKDYDAHVFVVAIDSFTGQLLRNPPGGLYGSVNPSSNTLVVFPFNTADQEGREDLINFLSNVMYDGMYGIVYTYQRPNYPDYYPDRWADDEQALGQSIFSVVEDIAPGSNIRDLESRGAVPYLLFFQKKRQLLFEGIANIPEETISYDYNFIRRLTLGGMHSVRIGPARTWKKFEWDYTFSNNPANDQVMAELIAFNKTYTDSLVVDVTGIQDTVLNFIDAKTYPYIELRFYSSDAQDFTTAQLGYWRVLYEGMPDLLINPAAAFEFEADTLLVGQPISLTTNVENLGEDMTDSTAVRFTITDANNNTYVHNATIPALKTGESFLIHHAKKDLTVAGKGSLLVELNSERNIEESNFFNNTGLLNFMLLADRERPVLDVTVDGRHLLNGDVVSAHPDIRARLHDNHPYLLLDDREIFEVLLRYPGEFDFTQIDIHGPDIGFEPATSGNPNTAVLTFRPTLEEGLYDLIIRAQDRSGNTAGPIEYAVRFEVIGDKMVTRVEAHPTTFNDHTTFVFTVSGTEAPAEVLLEIYNVTGQLVRKIDKEETGLFVGTTEYAWDGSTESGEPLPGGVYFYRLAVKDENGIPYDVVGPGLKSGKDAQSGKLIIVR